MQVVLCALAIVRYRKARYIRLEKMPFFVQETLSLGLCSEGLYWLVVVRIWTCGVRRKGTYLANDPKRCTISVLRRSLGDVIIFRGVTDWTRGIDS